MNFHLVGDAALLMDITDMDLVNDFQFTAVNSVEMCIKIWKYKDNVNLT